MAYSNIKLLNFHVNILRLITITKKIEAFRKLTFPDQLKILETYINNSGFLKHLIPYYSKLIEPIQERKIEFLAAKRKNRAIKLSNKPKRVHYYIKTTYELTEKEKFAFKAIQAIIYDNPKFLIYSDLD